VTNTLFSHFTAGCTVGVAGNAACLAANQATPQCVAGQCADNFTKSPLSTLIWKCSVTTNCMSFEHVLISKFDVNTFVIFSMYC